MRLGSTLSLLAVLCWSAPACIIDATDDDGSNSSSNATTNGNASGSATAASGSATASADAATASTAETTAGTGSCGWGQTGEPSVPMGYVCEGDGPDPEGVFPQACPTDATLQVGAACGEIEGPGCCDAAGDAWFCGDAGSGPALARIDC